VPPLGTVIPEPFWPVANTGGLSCSEAVSNLNVWLSVYHGVCTLDSRGVDDTVNVDTPGG
jgi:hypothetical protein